MGPNNQTILSNIQATADGTYYYSVINKGNFSEIGDYNYIYDCGNSEEKVTGKLDFQINYTGKELDGSTVSVYIASIFVLIFFFIIILLLINKLPSKDAVDDNGMILQVNNLKHLRPVLWGFSWGIILALMFIVSNIAIAYLPTAMIGNLFWAFFTIMFWLSMLALPLWFAWIFVGIWRDKEVKRMLERGVDIRGTP